MYSAAEAFDTGSAAVKVFAEVSVSVITLAYYSPKVSFNFRYHFSPYNLSKDSPKSVSFMSLDTVLEPSIDKGTLKHLHQFET
jgi:hypothetical protein